MDIGKLFFIKTKKRTWKADFLGLIITLEKRGDYAVCALVSVSESPIPGPAAADSPPVVSYHLKSVKERSREIITASGPFPTSPALP